MLTPTTGNAWALAATPPSAAQHRRATSPKDRTREHIRQQTSEEVRSTFRFRGAATTGVHAPAHPRAKNVREGAEDALNPLPPRNLICTRQRPGRARCW